MIDIGYFRLLSSVIPDLTAGNYRLNAKLDLQATPPPRETGEPPTNLPSSAVKELVSHLRVSSPRFVLPRDQILSTYPPALSEGSYEERLPQIVLKRRTLPWERRPETTEELSTAGETPRTPWLALVLLREDEGTIDPEQNVQDCVTQGVNLGTEQPEVPRGARLRIKQSVVHRIFPTKEDLHLLCHVREVNLADTELALGDDDGHLAVVIANRLPLFDQENCQPVKYTACLVNLEQQLHRLPAPSAPVFVLPALDFAAIRALAQISLDPDHQVAGKTARTATSKEVNLPTVKAKPLATKSVTSWVREPQVEKTSSSGGKLVAKAAQRVRATRVKSPAPSDPDLVFPVLVHWSFTSSGAGGFHTYMESLDVGMIGTLPPDPAGRKLPPCAPQESGVTPPLPDRPRPPLEFAETGHVGLSHLTRAGESVRAWYRGPLVPHVTTRSQADDEGRLPLAHTSDQLRAVVPDGREDLTYASAFEIGRLLALSQPSVVAALMKWRQKRFSAERSAQLVGAVSKGLDFLAGGASFVPQLGDQVASRILRLAGRQPGDLLAPILPLKPPGRPLPLGNRSVAEVLTRGLALPAELVTRLKAAGNSPGPVSLGVTRIAGEQVNRVERTVQLPPQAAEGLRGALTQHLDSIVGKWTKGA